MTIVVAANGICSRVTRSSTLWMLVLVCALVPGFARSQAWPAKPITVIVPAAPGAPIDNVARIVMPAMGADLGQPMVIKNMTGSGGIIGLGELAKAAKDGYSVGVIAVPLAIIPSLYKLPYDVDREILPVSILASTALVWAVSPTLPVSNVRELLALARSRSSDKTLTYGSTGAGTIGHLAFELVKNETGAPFLHVPYRGADALTKAVISGEVDAAFIGLGATAPLMQAGKMKFVGVATAQRAQDFPDIPTLTEQGIKGGEFDVWIALIAPAGLPQSTVDRLNASATKVLGDPAMRRTLQTAGYEVRGSTVAAARDLVGRDTARFAEVIKQHAIKGE